MAKEKRDIEINSRADTLPLMGPEVRPWPVTPPPTPEECMKVYEKRKAGEFGKFLEDNLRIDYSFDKPEAAVIFSAVVSTSISFSSLLGMMRLYFILLGN